MVARDPVVHVIDDDGAARESLTFLLGTARLTVRAYESAKAFLDIAATGQIGCLITDVRMPEIDGIELLRRLKPQKEPEGFDLNQKADVRAFLRCRWSPPF
jgi:two-component system response regulator FixJ